MILAIIFCVLLELGLVILVTMPPGCHCAQSPVNAGTPAGPGYEFSCTDRPLVGPLKVHVNRWCRRMAPLLPLMSATRELPE